jgi:hypothetical protein
VTGRPTGEAAHPTAEASLRALFRHRADVPTACHAALIESLSRLRGSEDPVVAFGRLPAACVPSFADGCQVELSDGEGPLFRTAYPAVTREAFEAGTDHAVCTPFRVVSAVGCGSYAGVVTCWWTGRMASDSDAVVADLMVRHVIALVDHERLTAAVARAEDRAARLAIEAISGRAIHLATGIVMHQHGLAADDAEQLLRRSATTASADLHQVAVAVIHAGALRPQRAAARPEPPKLPATPGSQAFRLAP